MKKVLATLGSVLIVCMAQGVCGETWFVNKKVSASGDGRSWQTAFKTIQEAIDAAPHGDVVVVAEGTYVENVRFNGKNITIRSTDPLDSGIVGTTIIDGNGGGPVITFAGTEDATCVLSGFTIRNGWNANGAGIFGGIPGQLTHATITNNVIVANRASNAGGGVLYCNGIIRNNVIAGNVAPFGEGLCECDGTIENNTIVANTSDHAGGGLANCDGTILNCVIWRNSAQQGAQVPQCSEATYSCIEDWEGWGEGNITDFPHLVDLRGGDYHPQSWSLCVDAGDPLSDYSNEPEPNGERIDMGAYGNTPEATSISPDADEDYLPDDWERHFFGDLTPGPDDDPDADGNTNLAEYEEGTNPARSGPWYVDASVAAPGDGTSWQTAFKTIQEGIDASSDGQRVTVAQGTYPENILLKGKNITLTGTNPLDSEVIANTVIDGRQGSSTVVFSGTEGETCLLSGFTTRNGVGLYGGGIRGNGTHAIISNNVITDNSGPIAGGAMSDCDGMIRNNVIARNSSRTGGAFHYCDGTIENNSIVGNSAIEEGGATYQCWAVIRNCIVWGNTASRSPQLDGWRDPTYSCIQDWQKGGAGNISTYPYFVDPESGDFHLRSWSPSIDMGDPSSSYSLEPMPNGGRIDLGAYGNTPEATSKSADTDSDGLPDDWEVFYFGDLLENGSADPDNDGFTNHYEYRDGFNPAFADPLAKNLNKGILYRTIQDAIRDSEDGNEIVVYPGVYRESINFGGKSIVLRSGLRPTPSFSGLAIIQGNQNAPVVTFSGSERDTCILSGFVVRDGTVGILGGTSDNPTHATIRNNIIAWNSTEGLLHCHGVIENFTIVGNGADGLRDCKGTIENCIIWGNGDGSQVSDCSLPDYCCVQGWSGRGVGNIADKPGFVDKENGDFRLLPSSPCTDAGKNSSWGLGIRIRPVDTGGPWHRC
ncbi:MAG: right-handed parallel beta-helix repeat-containing protein [bacterium]|nr:right-handed parallel beta-helix repeat-containing protein [bacterium]